MDKNLDSSPKQPWWMILLQIGLPILTSVVLEWVKVATGVAPLLEDNNEPIRVRIPDPIDVPKI